MAEKKDPVKEYLRTIGQRGGKAPGKPKGFATLTDEQRKANAKKAAETRWAKKTAVKKAVKKK